MGTKVSQAYVNDNNPIVEIKHYHPTFDVLWVISKRCNFACSYCPDIWHDDHSPHKTFDELVSAWKRIIKSIEHRPNLQINLNLMGGEPTLNPDLIPFLKWLADNYREKISTIGVITNGTATVDYYKNLIQYCNWITFSTHSEFMNEAKFFSTVSKVSYQARKQKSCSIIVTIMEEPWNQKRVEDYIKYLTKHNIDYLLQAIEDIENSRPTTGIKKTNKVNFYERIAGRK